MPEINLAGPSGRLEARFHPNESDEAPLAVMLHPHPLYGGTMNNKVVYNLHYCFKGMGFSVLRFNFRGVGRSEGTFDDGIGELSDAATALDFLQSKCPNAKDCWVAGFSFGAWVGMQLLMRRPEITGFVSASPPTNMYDFSFLAPCPASGMIINGSADPIVPAQGVHALAMKLAEKQGISIEHQEVEGAGHFFEGDTMVDMLDRVESYVLSRLAMPREIEMPDDD